MNALEFEHFYLGVALELHDEEGTPIEELIEDHARYDQALSQKSLNEIIVMNRQFNTAAFA